MSDALAALRRLTNYEQTRPDGQRAYSLERPARLLERLGNPQVRMGARVFQIAGTKGKGSTTRFIDSILLAAGRRSGRFLSPHIERIEERIAVNGIPIPTAELERVVARVLAAAGEGTTFFEAMFAAACLHFAEAGCEAVALEVGLGGRYDATSAVGKSCAVITGISWDHMDLLGDSLEAIAAEKAAILRPGVPLISGVDPAGAAGRIIHQAALACGAPYQYVPRPPCEVRGSRGIVWDGLELPFLGRHQAHNAALAAAACADCGPDAIRRGLATAKLPASCELFDGTPPVLLDGAHNDASIAATLQAVSDHLPGRPITLVFALSRDKDLPRVSALLRPAFLNAFCTRADAARGAHPADLAAALGSGASVVPEPAVALRLAREIAGPSGLVVVTGSIYLAGALRPLL